MFHLKKPSLLLLCFLLANRSWANGIEIKLVNEGLVDIREVNSSIQVDLVNSDPAKNFFAENFYAGLDKAYLRKQIAVMLSKAQGILRREHPSYSLLVLDAARPRSVSRAMYEKMKGTRFERYVANPDKGSMHNYGVAVDITIVNERDDRLDMGPSPFYSSRARIYMRFLLSKVGFGVTEEQERNRGLLKRVMVKAGFYPLSHEWWHFNGMKKEEARSAYSIIE